MRNPIYYKNEKNNHSLAFESQVVRGATGGDKDTGAISKPIYQTATFEHHSIEDLSGYNYARCINPTREELERTMCMLEEGTRAYALNSGMAAVSLVFSILKPGEHLIFSDDVYGGTFRCVDDVLSVNGVEYDSIDMRNLALLEETIRPNTKMILIETPSNPTMMVTDIEAVVKIAKAQDILVVVDNTLLTPYYQKPLALGADIIIHSGTKYLGGHNDVLSGIVVVKDEELGERLEIKNYIYGAALAPMDSWILLRGLKTLVLRMDKHTENAKKIAHWLRGHEKVKKVYYVGFEDHEDYEITMKQTTGFGGMISFELENIEAVNQLLEKIELIIFAESLGGVESLITHPTSRTHTEIDEEKKQRLGITETLLRLSVGIEDADDIIRDLEQALS